MKHQKKILIEPVISIGLFLILMLSCEKVEKVEKPIPVVSTSAISEITQTTAKGGGNITSDAGSAIQTKGICWSTSPNPTILNSKTSDGTLSEAINSNLTGLSPNTKYYVKAYASNINGTGYGKEESFTTLNVSGTVGSLNDIDNNTYKTIIIGSQVWVCENLKTTKYNDGTLIANLTNNTTWINASSGAYCWYNNNISFKATYGALYNWYAVNTNKLCPIGWHVPNNDDWVKLINNIGGANAGLIMKSSSGWYGGGNGTDNFGFKVLPSGERYGSGDFFNEGGMSEFWSSSEDNNQLGSNLGFSYWSTSINWSNYNYKGYKVNGYSVRCLKN